jgi:hypothetical protein
MNSVPHREYDVMTVATARPRETMSEAGDPPQPRAAPRVEDIERALVLAREVASATVGGGAANLRIEHLRALFANGSGPPSPGRMQAALEAAGLTVDPPLADRPDSVSLRVDKKRAALSDDPPPRATGVAAYQAATGKRQRKPARPAESKGVPLADAQRRAATEQADLRTPQSIAALMPALIVPVLAASFAGPLFGAIFAGLVLLTSALLSRPGALADGKLGPIRLPASLARSFLLVSFGVALGALAVSVALIAAGGESTTTDPDAPIEQPRQQAPTPQTTTPAQPQRDTAAERQAAADRRERAERAERRRERRERAAERRERAAEQQSAPPSGGGTTTP